MVRRVGLASIHGAGALSLLCYAVLAFQAGEAEARPWLILATGVGWAGLAAVAWQVRESRSARWAVIVWAIAFRLVGLGAEPTWEDDYCRYLWDGYQTLSTGDPYSEAPSYYFGREEGMPDLVVNALDQVNHPDIPTIYGPVAQLVFAVAAWFGAGKLWILKLGLVALELLGWAVLARRLSWRVSVVLWWCPLAVTEIAFAGHLDAIGVAALAMALTAWTQRNPIGASLGLAAAMGTKLFGVVLLPFVVSRFGWKWGLVTLLGVVGLYVPFWMQGSLLGGEAILAMSAGFEYNSTGYAVLKWFMPEGVARGAALGLFVMMAAGIWWRWRGGDRAVSPPLAVVFGLMFWWSPVFNPWYALWLLPAWALRPSAWGIGVLVAVSCVYLHGWDEPGGAVASYVHPWWTRPLEIVVLLLVVGGAYWWRRRGMRRGTALEVDANG